MVYFTSDTHFFDEKIISKNNRPFSSIDEMNETLIYNWNNLVKNDDEIYILGDFAVSIDIPRINSLFYQLNGTKYLIVGNHDKFVDEKQFDKSCIKWYKEIHRMELNGFYLVLCHFPFALWNKFGRGSINLYGHVHNEERSILKLLPNSFNVGVDVNDFKPVSLTSILNTINYYNHEDIKQWEERCKDIKL